jgi:hypothetical protein
MKIAGTAKRLADQPRANEHAIVPYELTGGLCWKGKMRNSSDHKRIDDAQKHRCNEGVEKSCDQMASHHGFS